MPSDLFKKINDTVLDIQSADYQTIERPLKILSKLLDNDDLISINNELTNGIDLEKFLEESERTGGGMVGSHKLCWPDNSREDLGLRLLLVKKLSDQNFATHFSFTFFSSGGTKIITAYNNMTRQLIIPFIRDYEEYIKTHGKIEPKIIIKMSKKIFIVHGHDKEARETVARFISSIGLEPIILHEQANRGRTVIEKVEANSDVGFAIVLLTPDDVGKAKNAEELEPRARQNVLLELGYFIAKLGRDRVCALKRGSVEIPSDFAGVVWETFDDNGAWKQSLGRELEASGLRIDWNLVMKS